jgi:hypothetical protein
LSAHETPGIDQKFMRAIIWGHWVVPVESEQFGRTTSYNLVTHGTPRYKGGMADTLGGGRAEVGMPEYEVTDQPKAALHAHQKAGVSQRTQKKRHRRRCAS